MINPLTIGVVRDIRNKTGVDILKIGDESVLGVVLSDGVWVGTVAAMCGGSDELQGDDLAHAHAALLSAIEDFFPKRSVFDDFEESNTKTHEVDPWRVVFRAAGCAGVEPWPYSLRELLWMAQGAFEPHAITIANFLAAHAKKGDKTPDPDTLNPYHPKRPRPRKTRAQSRPD